MKKALVITALLSMLFVTWNVAKAFDMESCPVGCWMDTKGNCFCQEEEIEEQKDEAIQDNS